MNTNEVQTHLQNYGFAVLQNVVPPATVCHLINEIDGVFHGQTKGTDIRNHAMRHLAEVVPAVKALAYAPEISGLVDSIMEHKPFLVRSIYFDKTAEANWKVAWHQDLTITVQRRIDIAGFGPWTVKDGVAHAQAPAFVLEKMLTVRLHLDDCDNTNGPLHVIPGSHRNGKLNAEKIQHCRAQVAAVTCVVKSGGVVLMRPLLLHASHRRNVRNIAESFTWNLPRKRSRTV